MEGDAGDQLRALGFADCAPVHALNFALLNKSEEGEDHIGAAAPARSGQLGPECKVNW